MLEAPRKLLRKPVGSFFEGGRYPGSLEVTNLTSAAPSVLSEPPDEDGPWFFAWVPPEEVEFDEELHARVDEWVFSVTIEHKEGDNSTATLEIENPGVGLLAPGRLAWMWISKRKLDDTIVPLFFGQLMAIPSDLLQTVVTITLVARAVDQESRKLAMALILKVPPYYDEIWVDLAQQNNPETVLEGYSSRWHFDRITNAVTTSDVLDGEDGTLEFSYDDLFWDGMNLTLDNVPLSSVSVRATVNWTQKAGGTIDLPKQNIQTLTGDGLLGDWPKPFSSLGGGWSTGESRAVDALNTNNTDTFSYSNNWKSGSKKHHDGDTVSASLSETYPLAIGPFSIDHMSELYITSMSESVTIGGGLSGKAGSASVNITYLYVPRWNVSTMMELRYDAKRERKEIVNFTLVADVQDILIETDNKANSERLEVNGRNVGNPLYVRATLYGTGGNVADGDQVLILSGPPYRFQTMLTPGEGHVHIGATLAESLANLVNAINVNGSGNPGVDYAEENDPNETAFAIVIDANSILLTGLSADEEILVGTTSSVLAFRASSTFTWTGSNPTNGQTATVGGIVYMFVDNLNEGINQITLVQNIVQQTPYSVLINPNSLEGTLINFAAAINAEGGAGSTYGTGTLQNPLAQASVFNGVLTVYPRYAIADLAVVGSFVSSTEHLIPDRDTVPIGDVTRRSYFSTDRGQQSIQALISRARAKLRISARAVKAAFVTDLEKGFALSCRKNVILNDPRFPGGQAMGKVISYYFRCNGDDGEEISGGEIGCAIGNGNVLVDDPGTPTYADIDYVDIGWQMYSDQHLRLNSDDIWYTPPIDVEPKDDGLIFPLTAGQAVLSNRMVKNHEDQQDALNDIQFPHPVVNNERLDAGLVEGGSGSPGVFFAGGNNPIQVYAGAALTRLHATLEANSMVHELVLAPVDGGPFSTRYEVILSELMIPKQVNLGAE